MMKIIGKEVVLSDPTSPERFVKVLNDALDRPIAFHRVFVKVTGSVTAALLLSQAMYWSKRVNSNNEGWFYKTRDQWEEETGLSRYEQESARKTLRKMPFWKEELRGVPAQMHYRVDMTALSNAMLCMAGANTFNKKHHKNARLLETSQLDGGKATNKKAGNQPACLRETSQLYKGISEITTEIKTTTTLPPLEPAPGSSGGPRGGHDFVAKLLVRTMLHGADPCRIANAARKYGRTREEIEKSIDVLDQQYRQSTRKIDDPTALIVCALKDGIDPPEDYEPKAQREAKVEQKRESYRNKADEERYAREAEDKAYREAEARLSALPNEKREELFAKVKTKLPAFLQNSQMAVKTATIKLMIADARAPG